MGHSWPRAIFDRWTSGLLVLLRLLLALGRLPRLAGLGGRVLLAWLRGVLVHLVVVPWRVSFYAGCSGSRFRGADDRSIYAEDPEGNVVEVWDYFEEGDGRVEGVAGLA